MPFDYLTAVRRLLTGELNRDPNDSPQTERNKLRLAEAVQDLDRDTRMLRAWLSSRQGRLQ